MQSDRQKEMKQIKEQLNGLAREENKIQAEFDKLVQSDKFLRDEIKYKT